MQGGLRSIPSLASSISNTPDNDETYGYSYVTRDSNEDHDRLSIVLWKNNGDDKDTFYLPTTHHGKTEEWTILDHVWTTTTITTSSHTNQPSNKSICIWVVAVLWCHGSCHNYNTTSSRKRTIQLYTCHWNETLQFHNTTVPNIHNKHDCDNPVEWLGANGLEWFPKEYHSNHSIPNKTLTLAISFLHGGVQLVPCHFHSPSLHDNPSISSLSLSPLTVNCELQQPDSLEDEESLCPGHVIYAMASSSIMMKMNVTQPQDHIQTNDPYNNSNYYYYFYFVVATSLSILIHQYELQVSYSHSNNHQHLPNITSSSFKYRLISTKTLPISSRITQLSFHHTHNNNRKHKQDGGDIYLAASSWDGDILLFLLSSSRHHHNNNNNDNENWITVLSAKMKATTKKSTTSTSRKYPTYHTFLVINDKKYDDYHQSFQLIHSIPFSNHLQQSSLQCYQITYSNTSIELESSSSTPHNIHQSDHHNHPLLSISHSETHSYGYNHDNHNMDSHCSLIDNLQHLNSSCIDGLVSTMNHNIIILQSNPTNPISILSSISSQRQNSYINNEKDKDDNIEYKQDLSCYYGSWKRWYLSHFRRMTAYEKHHQPPDLWLERRSFHDWYILLYWKTSHSFPQQSSTTPKTTSWQITNVNFLPQRTILRRLLRQETTTTWTFFREIVHRGRSATLNKENHYDIDKDTYFYNDDKDQEEYDYDPDDYLAIFLEPYYVYLYSRIHMGWKCYYFNIKKEQSCCNHTHKDAEKHNHNQRHYGWIGCITDSKTINSDNKLIVCSTSKLVLLTTLPSNRISRNCFTILIIWDMMNRSTNNSVTQDQYDHDEKVFQYELFFDPNHNKEERDEDDQNNNCWKIEIVTMKKKYALLPSDNNATNDGTLKLLRVYHHDGINSHYWDIPQYSPSKQQFLSNSLDFNLYPKTQCTLQNICLD